MSTIKLVKYSQILLTAFIIINSPYAKTQNTLQTAINAKQDSDQLNLEKDLMLCFIDITHESIINSKKLKELMEKITKKHLESIKNQDILYVIKFLDGDSKSKLKSLAVHINKVFNTPSVLKSFRTILAKIVHEIYETPKITESINNFLKNISNKTAIYKKLIAAEKSYPLNQQAQKDIINSKTVSQIIAIISRNSNKHMISNHNL